ncbi:MAG: T9SS type A sorting domain-containing protein [Saprospiraceae bacterium]
MSTTIKYMLVLLALMEVHFTSAQTDNCTPGVANGIRTNPENAVNPDCPAQVNTFDWRQLQYPYQGGLPPSQWFIQSPFWNTSNVNYLPLWDEENGGKDYQPADGWELVKKGVAPAATDYSYVLLYNRYTSILRVVFAVAPTQGDDYNFISVTIKFFGDVGVSGNMTALLHPRTGLSQPMDRPSVPISQSSVLYTQDYDRYMYADFPVEYDPCTCLQSGIINVIFNRIKYQDLDLYGRSLVVERTLANIQDFDQGMLEMDFLTQTYSTETLSEGFAGSHTFATYNRLVGHYNVLRQQQSQLKRQYAIFKAFNEVIGLVKPLTGAILKPIKIKTKIDIPLSDTTYEFTGVEILDAVAGIVNLFGAPIKTKLDAVNGKINTLGATSFSHGEMALKGKITTNTSVGGGISFRTPGRVLECNDALYPAYNEALGRFALLETPEADVQTHESLEIETPEGIPNILTQIRVKINPETIKYVFNSAAKIAAGTEIWAALRLKGGMSPSLNPHAYMEQTPLVPLSCIGNYIAGETLSIPYTLESQFEIAEVHLVLFVDYQFEGLNSDNETPRALAVYTYPVNIATSQSVETIEELWTATPDYPYELTLPATHFTQNQTIFAWSNITITGNLTAAPGVKVEILAPNIEVLNESIIGSDIWLHNDFVPFACEPLQPYQGSLQAFCTSNAYQGNISSVQSDDEALALRSSPPETTAAMELPFSMQVYPNPTNDYATLHLTVPEDGEAAAFLMDPRGQVAKQVFPRRYLPAGEHLFDLDMSDLPPGMYLLSVQTGQGKHSMRVVKQ